MSDAVEFVDTLGVSSEMVKEHLMDLCANKYPKEQFEKLSPNQKAAFTRLWNSKHKEGSSRTRAKKP